jgi:hypothetical protein
MILFRHVKGLRPMVWSLQGKLRDNLLRPRPLARRRRVSAPPSAWSAVVQPLVAKQGTARKMYPDLVVAVNLLCSVWDWVGALFQFQKIENVVQRVRFFSDPLQNLYDSGGISTSGHLDATMILHRSCTPFPRK